MAVDAGIVSQLAFDFRRSRILLTAHELGVFSALGSDERTSVEVAAAIKADARATDRLLCALCAMGFVERSGGRYRNAPGVERLLVPGGEEYMAGLSHAVHLWRSWSNLTDAVRAGTAVNLSPMEERPDEWREAFIAAMHWRAANSARETTARLDLSDVKRTLDVGGGSGAFSIAFAKAQDGLIATVFDLPRVVPLAKRYVEEAGLTGRVEFVSGDYHADPFPGGYDLVFLSAIVHSNSAEENRRLTRKCADALAPGGRLVIQDHVMNEDRATPPGGAFFALNMLVATERGDTFTESDIRSWMTDAGVGGVRREQVSPDISMMIGRKPA